MSNVTNDQYRVPVAQEFGKIQRVLLFRTSISQELPYYSSIIHQTLIPVIIFRHYFQQLYSSIQAAEVIRAQRLSG